LPNAEVAALRASR